MLQKDNLALYYHNGIKLAHKKDKMARFCDLQVNWGML